MIRAALLRLVRGLHRRYTLAALRGRQRQLVDYIKVMQQQAADDADDVALAQAELAAIGERLAREEPPTTGGQP